MKQKDIDEIRAFNRFYTVVIGLIDKHLLKSEFTLPEVRVMFEIYHGENVTASDLTASLQMDKGYLSRILKQFEKKKLIKKTASNSDKRSSFLELTSAGKKEFEVLNQASNDQIQDILRHLSDEECRRLVADMKNIRRILNKLEA
jgi:DNA-binding MarR family transcriptional regulator